MTENVQQRSMFEKLIEVLVIVMNLSIGLPFFLYVGLCLSLLVMNAIGTLFVSSSAHFIEYMPATSGLSSAARDYLIYEYHVPKSGYRMCESSYQSTSSMEIPLDILELVLQFESTKIHMITSLGRRTINCLPFASNATTSGSVPLAVNNFTADSRRRCATASFSSISGANRTLIVFRSVLLTKHVCKQ